MSDKKSAGQRVRVSVANLASYLVNNDTGEVVAIGIANKKRFEKDGKIFLQALGGAAEMTEDGKKHLEETYSAVFLGEGDDLRDVRFTIPVVNLKVVLALFEVTESDFCEQDPMREVRYELEQETICSDSILCPKTLARASSSVFEGVFYQESAEDGVGTSLRAASQEIPTKRLFFVHTLRVLNPVFLEILASPYVTRLSEKELDTTQMGRTKGITRSRSPMSDNLCNWIPGYLT